MRLRHRRSATRPLSGALLLAAVAIIVLGLSGASSAAAQQSTQSVRGVVLDHVSEAPLHLAMVTIVDAASGAERGTVVTDGDGRFQLTVSHGSYRVEVRRLGYAAIETVAHPVSSTAPLDLVLPMRAASHELPAVETSAERNARHVHLGGFEERRRQKQGYFITREEITARGFPSAIDLLRGVPGLRLTGFSGRTPPSLNRTVVPCSPVVFIDGIRMNSSEDSPVVVREQLESLAGDVIEAIEVYNSRSSLPAEFASRNARCGAIVIWTRVPGPGRARR